MSRGHKTSKQVAFWIPVEDFDKFEKFLDKYSAGDSFADRARNFVHWLISQEEGLNATKLAVKREQVEKLKQEEQCLRGIIMPFHKQEQKTAFCFGCRQHHSTDFWKCFEKRKAKELEEANKT